MKIKNRNIGVNEKPYFIADIAANHDGCIERAKSLIWQAAESGADAAKFQNFTAETLVSNYGFKKLNDIKTHQNNWEDSVFDVYNKASIPLNWTKILFQTCVDAKIDYFTSLYNLNDLDFLNEYVAAWKIGSGDITWHSLIDNCSSTNKPLILATGASNIEEVKKAVKIISNNKKSFVLMQCNTNYSGSIENFSFIELNVLKSYNKLFPNAILGLSDHTPGHATVLGAIALGASVIEKHFTDDNTRKGSDHPFSMEPHEWKEMVDRSLELKMALGTEKKEVMQNEFDTRIVQRRAIRCNREINIGEVLKEVDLTFLRPCPKGGLPPYEVDKIIGKVVKKRVDKGDIIKISDLG
jgi:sialic acid synthase SpsE